jgi:hypothetical protein
VKFQFQKEDHNRQDKTKKGDYIEEIRERGPTDGSWSGVNMENIQKRKRIRDAELEQAATLFFVYGKWLYQNTAKLSYFAQLNSKHATSGDPELEAAFQKCRRNWQVDFPKILSAIKRGIIERPKGFPKGLRGFEVVRWEWPSDLIADEVCRKMPLAFRCKRAPKNTTDTSTAPKENSDTTLPSTN